MAEDLQSLLDRIREDGVEKADARAAEIVQAAEQKAAKIVNDAEEKARQTLAKAEEDAQVFTERSTKALEQAARDVVLSVGSAITKTVEGLVAERVGKELSKDLLEDMLEDVVKAYASKATKRDQVEILLSPKDQEKLQDFFMSELRKEAESGLTIKSDDRILGGFQVSIKNRNVHHDFTQESIAEALCELVRPRLAEIIQSALADKS